jgi:hypothetical protein
LALNIPPVQDISLTAKILNYPLRAFVINIYNIWHSVSNFFFKRVKLPDIFNSKSLADACYLHVLFIFHSFSSFSASIARRLPVTFQNIFWNILDFRRGSPYLKKKSHITIHAERNRNEQWFSRCILTFRLFVWVIQVLTRPASLMHHVPKLCFTFLAVYRIHIA